MQTRERAHCARSVFPFIKKKGKASDLGLLGENSGAGVVERKDIL